MFKRVGSIALIVMMLISMLCTVTVASAAPAEKPELVLTADATTVKHGQTVTITVGMKNAIDMAGIQIAFPYNKALFSYVGYVEKLGDGFLEVNAESGAFINIVWTNEDNMKPTVLVDLQFKVNDKVDGGILGGGKNEFTVQDGATILELTYAEVIDPSTPNNLTYANDVYVEKSERIEFTVDCSNYYIYKGERDDAAVSGDATTAQHKLTCSKCGYKEAVACSFGAPNRVEIDSCDSIGTDRITCEVCRYHIDTPVDEIKGHSWSAVWYQDAEAHKHYKLCLNGCGTKNEVTDCSGWVWNNVATKNGSKHTCPTCNRVVACDWADHPNEFQANCTEDAYDIYKCASGCGATYKVVHAGTATGHKYDNSCDASCNVCGATRPIEHKYDNSCDTTCNVCGVTRTITHTYTNSCDIYCNICGVSRAGGHKFGEYVYNNDATTEADGTKTRTCSVCGEKDTIVATGTKLKPTITFVDVKAGEFYATPVQWAVENGITNGTSATTFSPNAPCTRGQIVTFLWRAAGSPEPQTTKNPFTDVKSSEYYYKAVLWAVEKGITNGTSATTFSPNATCTRGQVVTFLWRAKGKPAVSGSNPFKDVKAGEYYTEAVVWAVKNGITNGTSATTFGPNDNCTRSQIVTFLYRAYK